MIKLDGKIISIYTTIFILITVISPIFIITAEAADTDYYLSNSGNNLNSGTSPDQAWKTKSKLNTELASGGCINDGDDIYFMRGDTFDEDVYVGLRTTDGTSSNPMIFGAYGTGADPIITASTVTPYFYFLNDETGYWTFENLHFQAPANCGTERFIAGNTGDKYNLTIHNCTFDGNNPGANGHKGEILLYNVHNYIIRDCTFTDASHYLYGQGAGSKPNSNTKMINCVINGEGGDTDNMQIHAETTDPTGNGPNHYIYNVTSYNCMHNAFDIVGGWYNQYKCENVYIKDCRGYDTDEASIVIGHGVSNVTLDGCYFEGSTSTPYLTRSNNTIIRNCVFKVSGNILGQDDPQWAYGWGTQNATIYHNTFITGDGGAGRFISANAGWTSPENLSGFKFKNNIFYSTAYSTPTVFLLYHANVGSGGDFNLSNTDSNFSYNMWWRGDGDFSSNNLWQPDDDNCFYDFTDWLAQPEVHNDITANASLVNPTGSDFDNDFDLTSGSPAINSGDWLTFTVGGGTGTTITLDDANYFFPGISSLDIIGDTIFVGDDTNLVVVSVDYKLETITVNRSITWSNGDFASLSSYRGFKPDMGACEFVSTGS